VLGELGGGIVFCRVRSFVAGRNSGVLPTGAVRSIVKLRDKLFGIDLEKILGGLCLLKREQLACLARPAIVNSSSL